MRPSMRVVGIAVLVALSAGLVLSQDVGPTGPSPYDVVEGWLKPFAREGFALGGNSGVFAESPDRIFVLQRGETRLPDPVPPEFSGFVGSIGINALRGEGRTWQNCIFVVDGYGNVIEDGTSGTTCSKGRMGPGRTGFASAPTIPSAGCGSFMRRCIRFSCSPMTVASS